MTVRIQLNHAAVRDLLRGPATERLIKDRTEEVLQRAGPGHVMEMYRGRNRWRGTVRTETIQALTSQSAHETLTRALKS